LLAWFPSGSAQSVTTNAFWAFVRTSRSVSQVDDVVAVLDRFGIERAAVVGHSGGGGVAIDLALDHPDRVWAVAHVSGAVGLGFEFVVPEELAGADQMTRDFAVWAPLGADDLLRKLWHATPKARGLPTGADLLPPP
jgi:pimeloyl-ACP methyl ester carboxylesterase